MWVEKMLKYLISQLQSIDVHKWEATRFRVAETNRKMLPEVKVIEALRTYMDGVWGGPEEAKRCWTLVIKALEDLDKNEVYRIEEAVKHSKITDPYYDWHRSKSSG